MFLALNPFILSYVQSDWLGRAIFWALFLISATVWSLLIYKIWVLSRVTTSFKEFRALFSEKEPLSLQFRRPLKPFLLEIPHPFFDIYKTCKHYALQMLERNHLFHPEGKPSLSESDLNLLEVQAENAIASQIKKLEKNLYLLSTTVTLAPFLGLLGTVWGILISFSSLQGKTHSLTNASMLSGLSLALATTVVGLLVAIPALVGNNFLRAKGRDVKREMEEFSQLLLTSIELQYRKPNHAPKSPIYS